MAKIQSRTEKFKEYREEIKNSCKEEIETPSQTKIPSNFFEPEIQKPKVSVKKEVKTIKVENNKPVTNKHVYEHKEKPVYVKQKTIYDEYVRSKLVKRFLYFIFVLIIIGLLVTILILSLRNF